jgi:hypothetical protein
MSIYIFSCDLFRDNSRLRLTKEGRLIIKSNLVKALNIAELNQIYLHSVTHQADSNLIYVVLSVKVESETKALRISDIGGLKIISLKESLSAYKLKIPQYAEFDMVSKFRIGIKVKLETKINAVKAG